MLVTLMSDKKDLNKAIIPMVEAIFALTHASSLQELYHIRSYLCLWLPTNIRPCLVNSAASPGRSRASAMSRDVKWIGVIAVLNANLLTYTHGL